MLLQNRDETTNGDDVEAWIPASAGMTKGRSPLSTPLHSS